MGKVVTREWRKAKVLNWNLHLCQLLEMIQVFDSISWVRCASGNVSMISSENEGHRCDAGQSDEKEDRKCLVAPQRVRITMLAPTECADNNACTPGGADNNTFYKMMMMTMIERTIQYLRLSKSFHKSLLAPDPRSL